MTTQNAPSARDSGLRLIVMRHAKSDWGDESLSDHQRPLNPRGRRDAPRMAAWLEENGLVPRLILSSSSERTRQTVELMLPCWAKRPHVLFTDELYLASVGQMVSTIQLEHEGAESIMILAHNPGVSTLVGLLSGQSAELPTAAVAAFEVEAKDAATFWSEFSVQRSAFEETPDLPMKLTHFMRPKALGDP